MIVGAWSRITQAEVADFKRHWESVSSCRLWSRHPLLVLCKSNSVEEVADVQSSGEIIQLRVMALSCRVRTIRVLPDGVKTSGRLLTLSSLLPTEERFNSWNGFACQTRILRFAFERERQRFASLPGVVYGGWRQRSTGTWPLWPNLWLFVLFCRELVVVCEREVASSSVMTCVAELARLPLQKKKKQKNKTKKKRKQEKIGHSLFHHVNFLLTMPKGRVFSSFEKKKFWLKVDWAQDLASPFSVEMVCTRGVRVLFHRTSKRLSHNWMCQLSFKNFLCSLKDFVCDAGDFATKIVDDLLNIFTGHEHSKANKIFQEVEPVFFITAFPILLSCFFKQHVAYCSFVFLEETKRRVRKEAEGKGRIRGEVRSKCNACWTFE